MARTPSQMIPLGTPASSFALPDIDGEIVSLSDYEGEPLLVMFICNHCPFVKHVRTGLSAFAYEYTRKGLSIVAINSNDVESYPDDSPEKMKIEASEAGYVFPYLYDETQDVNLLGGPALTPREFASHRPTTILGLSLAVAAPTGQYDHAKLVNIGSNRWSFKPEVGFSRTKGRWYLELYGGVWIFGTNGDYYGGSTREQDPLGTFQAHASYTIKPRLWLAADATFYTGGRTTVNGAAKADLQRNSRLGAALALPVGRRSALKVSWATGFTTGIGADFDSIGVAFQTVWSGRP